MKILEYAFYIHGVIPDWSGKSHEGNYNVLHQGISDILKNETWPTLKGGAEWGWQQKDTKRKSHRALAGAQKVFGGKVLEALSEASDFTLNPARLALNGMRETMMYGFGDMFYYVSTEGKWAVRNAVAAQLREHIEKSLPKDYAISLTLLGHSAGSVIAFDLLFYLFMSEKKFERLSWLTERGGESTHSAGEDDLELEELKKNFDYLFYLFMSEKKFERLSWLTERGSESTHSAGEVDLELEELKENFDYLRKLVRNKRLRLRMLVTFGSPISMLMYRSDKLVEILACGDTLTPEQYGLRSEIEGHPLYPDAPRWLNIWDKDDLISWPVSPVMGNHHLVKDEYIDVSDNVVTAHNRYWNNKKVQKTIAKYWKALNQ